MMSAVEETKTADAKEEEMTKMDASEDTTSKEEIKTGEDKSNSSTEAVVIESASDASASEKATLQVEVKKDVVTTVSVDPKDKTDSVVQEPSMAQEHSIAQEPCMVQDPSQEDLDSSSTQLETSMDVDTCTDVDAAVQSENIRCIPESQESCESMDTEDVKEKEELGGAPAQIEETKVPVLNKEQNVESTSVVENSEKKEVSVTMEEEKSQDPSPLSAAPPPPPPPPPPPLPPLPPLQGVLSTDEDKKLEENVDDWEVFASDEEGEEGKTCARTGVFEPPAAVIIELFERLDKEGVLELEWKCLGRRPPEEDKEEMMPEVEVQPEEKPEKEEQKEKEPTAFDFDVPDPIAKVTPRRALGSAQAQGSGKKRVARMDKVLNDIMRHKNIDDNDFEFGDDDNEMDTTPQRKLNKFHIRRDLDA